MSKKKDETKKVPKKEKKKVQKEEKEDLSHTLEVWDMEGRKRVFKFDEKGEMI